MRPARMREGRNLTGEVEKHARLQISGQESGEFANRAPPAGQASFHVHEATTHVANNSLRKQRLSTRVFALGTKRKPLLVLYGAYKIQTFERSCNSFQLMPCCFRGAVARLAQFANGHALRMPANNGVTVLGIIEKH